MEINKIICGDTLTELKKFPNESVDCIITSPPYYGLRDYGTAKWKGGDEKCDHVERNARNDTTPEELSRRAEKYGSGQGSGSKVSAIQFKDICSKCGAKRIDKQLGLESTLEEYLKNMLAITAELKRVLKNTGTMFWNHGDSYAGSMNGAGDTTSTNRNKPETYKQMYKGQKPGKQEGIPNKSLLLQAHRLAIRMVDEQGWILRNCLIWHKPNCMPSSVKDRFTVDYEPVFFFTKSKKYWFEPQYEPHESSGGYKPFNKRVRDVVAGRVASHQYKASKEEMLKWQKNEDSIHGENAYNPLGRNKRCVWRIPTKPFPEAHFAVFPESLVETPIKAGCPEFICEKCGVAREKIIKSVLGYGRGNTNTSASDITAHNTKSLAERRQFYRSLGYETTPYQDFGHTDCGCENPSFRPGIVLDPFSGAGTTALVALRLKRSYIGIELNPEYIKIANKRLASVHPSLF